MHSAGSPGGGAGYRGLRELQKELLSLTLTLILTEP